MPAAPPADSEAVLCDRRHPRVSGMEGDQHQPAAIDDELSRDFPELSHLTRDEILALLSDESHFDAVFHTLLPASKELLSKHEQKIESNIKLAQSNEQLRPQLEQLRQETIQAFNDANELKQRWSYIDQAQQEAFKRFSPAAQLNRLKVATSNQDNLAEALVQSFNDGNMDEEEFVRQYKEVRRVYWRRHMSTQKWEDGKVVWRM